MKKASFSLTLLEKAALLKKAGIVNSLIEGCNIHLKELGGIYDAEKAPAGEWDDTSWYGGSNTGGQEGYCGLNTICRVELSGKKFVVLVKEKWYVNNSGYKTVTEEQYPDGNYPGCGFSNFVFLSEGEEIDSARINAEKLKKLLLSATAHLPEALELFRVEAEEVMEVLIPAIAKGAGK